MQKFRLGVIGLGNIGRHHATYLSEGQVEGCELTAVCSSSSEKREAWAGKHVFSEAGDLIRSGTVDAVIVATPHFQHVPIGIDALNHGLHVMLEKPIAADKAGAQALIAAHREHPDLVFAAMFQFRVEPRYLAIRELLQSGGLGRLLRISWIMTDWFRTQAYYASGGWRATWRGEGGGVLLNQCLHNLDTLQWLLGMPLRVRGFCRLGAHHDIEVEDDVTAWMEFAHGAFGTLITSTAESPGVNRLEIAGTKGRLLLENNRLFLTENAQDSAEFSRGATLGFAKPDHTTTEIPFGSVTNAHAALTRNFARAIQGAEPLVAPGADGICSVELANAILYSALEDRTIDLPLDSAAYAVTLNRLIASSTREKRVRKIANEDIASSFRK